MDWPTVAGAIPVYLVACADDLALRRIPDRCSVGLIALGLAGGLITNAGAIPLTLGVAAAVFLLLAAANRAGVLGGGDVKLLAASTVLVGAPDTPQLLAATALAGGALSLGYLAGGACLRRWAPPTLTGPVPGGLTRLVRLEAWRMTRHRSLPYGLAIAAGGLLTLLTGTLN